MVLKVTHAWGNGESFPNDMLGNRWIVMMVYQIEIPPLKLTWNLKMMVSNRNLLFQGFIFRFHVSFPGCRTMSQPCFQWSEPIFGSNFLVGGSKNRCGYMGKLRWAMKKNHWWFSVIGIIMDYTTQWYRDFIYTNIRIPILTNQDSMESKVLIFFSKAEVSVTIMYMLLGVLVDVIGAVASTEKQKIEITYIVGDLEANPSEYDVSSFFKRCCWKIHL